MVFDMTVKEKILVIGVVDVGGIARSAKGSGYSVYTVDFFGDLDVERYSNRSSSILSEYKGELKNNRDLSKRLLDLARKLVHENDIDFILLSSGLDDKNDVLESLHEMAPIMGNPPDVIKLVRDKFEFFETLKKANLDFPTNHLVGNLKECLNVAKDIGFPLIVKPTGGFGGIGVVKMEDRKDLEKFYKGSKGELLVQEYLPGIPASLSILANGTSSKVLSLNEQLLGIEEFGLKEEFVYCGGITPLDVNNEVFRKCEELANKVAANFGLKGSNGIDIVLSSDGKISVIEVNPRFQSTIECVENYLKINLVEEHVKTCVENKLPSELPKPESSYFSRGILYAQSNLKAPDLSSYDFVRDMPKPGYLIPEGDPICSVITYSNTRNKCLYETKHLAEKIYNLGRSK